MRKVFMPALIVGLLIAACGDDTTGGNGGTGGTPSNGGGGSDDGGGGTGATGAGGSGAEGGGGSPAQCGDGTVDDTEGCDDGNVTPGDGCDDNCDEEDGFDCAGEPSDCVAVCGDGTIVGGEACDDGNGANDDGCSDTCDVEDGFECTGEPSVCEAACGNGTVSAGEDCDDGNNTNTDGCSSMCEIETGYDCTGSPSVCDTECGDGAIGDGEEECDDGDATGGDGCDANCQIENGFSCAGMPSVCTTGCGDGIVAGAETCDDGDMTAGDGCDDDCAVEAGYNCVGMPSVCTLSGSCAAPIIVTGDGFVFQTADMDQYGDDLDFEDASCAGDSSETMSKPDLVFSVALAAGDTLHVAESGSADVLMHVITGACASATACAESFDGIGAEEINPGLVYQATTAGTVLVVVDNYGIPDPTDDLDLLFEISPCGDGDVGAGEACDDGDVTGGDGCSATCAIETGYGCTGEPSVCTLLPGLNCGNPILASDGFVFQGSVIANYGDDLNFTDASCRDVSGSPNASPELVFQIGLTAGQRLNVAEFSTLDVVMQVLSGTCGVGTCAANYDDDAGGGETAGLTFVAPTSGTYFVAVESYFPNPAATPFEVRFNIAACGDGVVEFGEACDDADLDSGDGCSSTCTVEAGFTCVGSPSVCTGLPAANCANPIVVNSAAFTFAGTNIQQYLDTENYNLGTNCVDVSTTPPSGFDLVFRRDLIVGETVRVRELGGLDAVMHILQAPQCGAGVTCAASTDTTPPETTGITFTATTAGPVFIVVESYGNPSAATTFDIRIDTTRCGDGVLAASEGCDDGNATAGDGCSATCTVETNFICETPGQACFSTAACAAGDLVCFLGPCVGGNVVTASAPGLPLAIPDNVPAGGLTLNIPVVSTGTIRKMIVKFEATHTYDDDIDFFLTKPGGMPIDVFSDVGNFGGDNFVNTLLRDNVVVSIAANVAPALAPFTGVFRPETAFAPFNGTSSNGTWVARVADDANQDLGTLNTLSLGFCMNP